MKISILHFCNRQFTFALISILVLYVVTSCTPAQKDSRQPGNKAVVNHNQVQENTNKEEAPSVIAQEAPEQPPSPQAGEKVAINPPHGQPGHRCEIPVGSPLNASPANADKKVSIPTSSPAPATVNNPTAPTIQNANRMNPSQTRSSTAPATGTKPANNPPHGQPWHRCDIPVGSPLP